MLASRDRGDALRGPERDEALADLRAVLVRGLRVALGAISDDLPEAAIEDFAQEALVKILRNLDSFRGESRFTTGAQRIAMHVAFTDLRRRRWRDVSLQELVARYEEASARLDKLTDPLPTPEKLMTQEAMLATVERLVAEGLSPQDVLAVFDEG